MKQLFSAVDNRINLPDCIQIETLYAGFSEMFHFHVNLIPRSGLLAFQTSRTIETAKRNAAGESDKNEETQEKWGGHRNRQQSPQNAGQNGDKRLGQIHVGKLRGSLSRPWNLDATLPPTFEMRDTSVKLHQFDFVIFGLTVTATAVRSVYQEAKATL